MNSKARKKDLKTSEKPREPVYCKLKCLMSKARKTRASKRLTDRLKFL